MYNFSFFGQILFCKHFYYITGFCDKKLNFCKFANFFLADSKRRAQELSNDVSFVLFGHKTWDLEGGGGQIDPPSISWFLSAPAGIGLNYNIWFTSQKRKVLSSFRIHIFWEKYFCSILTLFLILNVS